MVPLWNQNDLITASKLNQSVRALNNKRAADFPKGVPLIALALIAVLP